MRIILITVCLLFLNLIIFSGVSNAENQNYYKLSAAQSQSQSIPLKQKEIIAVSRDDSFLSQIKLFGTFAASYTYNLARPYASEVYPLGSYNGNYIDNYKANGPTINQFDVTVSKNPFTGGRNKFGIGFKVSIDTGQNIQAVGPYTGNYSYYTEPMYDRPLYGFRQFYISFGIPVGHGLKIDLGEKNYLIGFESYNLSRLWENTYSLITAIEPGELTGVFLKYPFTRQLKMVFGAALTDNSMVPLDRYPTLE